LKKLTNGKTYYALQIVLVLGTTNSSRSALE